MSLKRFFKNKKNIVIICLSIGLIGSMSNTSNHRDKVNQYQKTNQLLSKQLKAEKKEFKRYKEENEDYISAGKLSLKRAKKEKSLQKQANKAILKLENNPSDELLLEAEKKVALVTNASVKDKFQKRINNVKPLIEAKNVVEKLEADKTNDNLVAAQTKVNALKESSFKTTLKNRIEKVKKELEKLKSDQANAEAENAVITLEKNQTRDALTTAQSIVNALTDTSKKEALSKRISAVDATITKKENEQKEREEKAAAEIAAAQEARQNQFADTPSNQASPSSFANCTLMHEAGIPSVSQGDPRYSTRLDRDHDGVACE